MFGVNDTLEIPETNQTVGTGWLPPMPDLRDYTVDHPVIAELTKRLGISPQVQKKFELKAPAATPVDLRPYCSPIEYQGGLGSCSAHAGMGIVEYFENRAHGKYINGSRLFLYKTTRNLMGVTGDTGAWLRNVMGALVLCGVPPEVYWRYVIPDFDKEPTAFVYSVADNYEAIRYFCHDPMGANIAPATVLASVKTYLAAGIPSMFGFTVFSSINQAGTTGRIPFPCTNDRILGGHAVIAVGYNDSMIIKNSTCGTSTQGALLIRNSWGETWGDKGYGWLPYDYIRNEIALDFWSLLNQTWIDTGIFKI